ncbi:MAG: hypothetical protein N2327_01900 [Caldimicrobium sp.]|nr:hypothetical protein [Caldimicrobium sp.]MCX7873172.1 hypothetical protein [Caldimicrobium sp.]MDW8094249.1 hypothetical protein [Caldimicrobium sp.]
MREAFSKEEVLFGLKDIEFHNKYSPQAIREAYGVSKDTCSRVEGKF